MFACAFPLLFCFATLVYIVGLFHYVVCYFKYLMNIQNESYIEVSSNVQNNVTEIRTDALKLLVMLKRPIPRAAATIGAWLNIFQVCNQIILWDGYIMCQLISLLYALLKMFLMSGPEIDVLHQLTLILRFFYSSTFMQTSFCFNYCLWSYTYLMPLYLEIRNINSQHCCLCSHQYLAPHTVHVT